MLGFGYKKKYQATLTEIDYLVKKVDSLEKNNTSRVKELLTCQQALKLTETEEYLRALAHRLGYSVLKRSGNVNFVPCTCGFNRRKEKLVADETTKYQYVCMKCGKTSPLAETKRAARIAWNDMIAKESNEKKTQKTTSKTTTRKR